MNLLQMSISSAIMIAAVVVIRALAMNQLPKKAFVALWGVALFRLLVPFAIPSELSIYSMINRVIERNRPETVRIVTGEVLGSISSAGVTAPMLTAPVEAVAEIPWMLLIWTVGFAACVLFFSVSYLHCRRKFATATPVTSTFVQEWLTNHQIKRHITVRQSDRIAAPLTYGTFHPTILLPKHIDWSNESQINYILEHEYVHIRRFDGVIKLFLLAALCVHWFNPLVWAMFVLANRDIELSCDETVVHSLGDDTKAAYARVLICMEEKKSGLMPLCNNFSKNAIEERIRAIMKLKKSTWISMSAAVVVVVGVIVFLATGNKNPLDKTINMGILEGTTKTVMAYGSGAQGDITQVSSMLDGVHPNEFVKADTEKKSVVMEFPGEQPTGVSLRYYKGTDAATEQEYPIDTTNYSIQLPTEAGNYTFIADVTWKDKSVNSAFFSASIKPDEVKVAATDDGIQRFAYVTVYDDDDKVTGEGRVTISGSTSRFEANLSGAEKKYKQEKEAAEEEIKKSKEEIDKIIKNRASYIVLEGEDGKSIEIIQPVVYTRVSAPYGWTKQGETSIFHMGVDLAAPESTDIYAAADGEVIFSGWSDNFGNNIVIKHDNDYETLYAHCKKLNVKKGDIVKRGDVIGAVGQTGMATGNHLHFEMHKDGAAIDSGIGLDKSKK